MKRSLIPQAVAIVAIASVAAPAADAAPVTAKTVPFVRALQLHSKGKDVARLQSALMRAHVRPSSRRSTGEFGVITRYEVRRWQRLRHIEPSGVVGRPTKASLWPFYTPYARGVEVRAAAWHQHMLAVEKARAAELARLRASFSYRVLEATSDARSHAFEMAYSQSWTRQNLPSFPSVPRATDCSGYATWVLRHAGVNPGGHGYVGWTGTLGREGWAVSSSSMHVGDLVFYGGGYPYGHVAVYIGHGLVSSHGGPGINVLPYTYRPVEAIRRYHA